MPAIKLSAPEARGFWEISVLFEDEHLMALNKPAQLPVSPDSDDPGRPNLMNLLHRGIKESKPWARQRDLAYLANAHRLDVETTGVLLLAKNKPALVELANIFGSGKALKTCVVLVRGTPEAGEFEVNVPLGPHPRIPGLVAANPKSGRKSQTRFQVIEKFRGYTLLKCVPLTDHTHQIRVHARWVKLPIVGDSAYRSAPLLLSDLKRDYRLASGKEERPLISTLALHAEQLTLPRLITGEQITITAPWPKDLQVALKYLRRYAE